MSGLILPLPEITWVATNKNGVDLAYRPIRTNDTGRLARFHHELSDHTVYLRWINPYPLHARIEPSRLLTQCSNDVMRGFAIVATMDDEIVGVGRCMHCHHSLYELAFVVRDKDQGTGVGKELFRGIMVHVSEQTGKTQKPVTLTAEILAHNKKMSILFQKFGFSVRRDPDDWNMVHSTRDCIPSGG